MSTSSERAKRNNLKVQSKTYILALASLVLLGSVLFMVLVYFNISWAQTPQTPIISSFSAYSNPKYGFSIEYPANWKIQEDPTSAVVEGHGIWFISPGEESGNLRIERQENQKMTLGEVVSMRINSSKIQFPGYQVITRNTTALSGGPAEEILYNFKVLANGFLTNTVQDFKGMQIFLLRGEHVYVITYFSSPENFEIFLPLVEKAINSLEIIA